VTTLWRALYFVRTALDGLRSSPVTSAVAVGTIATTLVVMGVFGLALKQMSGIVARVGEDLTVSAYLADSVDDAAARELATRVATVEGVASVEVVTRDEALRRFESAAGDRTGLLDGLVENPLPASLEIALAPSERSKDGIARLVDAIEGLPGIEEVGHGEDWVDSYGRVLGGLRVVALVLGLVFALAALLIVSNTIRLAVYARRDEVEILALVGASRGFIGTPFVLEGALEGSVGALLALAVLFAGFELGTALLGSSLAFLIGHSDPVFFDGVELVAFVIAGASLGCVGSLSALGSAWRAAA
jgi:cell division transport system permease protein